MNIPIRNAVRIILLNNEDKLLLMCVEDFDIATPDDVRHKRFWCTIGGGIEAGESIEQAAFREIYEETSLTKETIKLGPIVWESEIDLKLKGTLTRLKEYFIVAKTQKSDVSLHLPTHDEKAVVKKLVWFSLNEIKNSSEVIFPILLTTYLPDILAGKYPQSLIDISIN